MQKKTLKSVDHNLNVTDHSQDLKDYSPNMQTDALHLIPGVKRSSVLPDDVEQGASRVQGRCVD